MAAAAGATNESSSAVGTVLAAPSTSWMDKCPAELRPSLDAAIARRLVEHRMFPHWKRDRERFHLDFQYDTDSGVIRSFGEANMDMQRETAIGHRLFTSGQDRHRNVQQETDDDGGGLTLLLMMKEEQIILPRLLGSLRPYIRSYIVLDTVSTRDASPEFVRRYLEGIPGTIYSMPMLDFGTGRTCLMHLAHQHRTAFLARDHRFSPVYRWGLLMDGDYQLDIQPDLKPPERFRDQLRVWSKRMVARILMFTAENHRYSRPHILNMNTKWSYICRTHEAIQLDPIALIKQRPPPRGGQVVWDKVRIDHKSDGQNKQNKYWRDLVWLLMDRIDDFNRVRSEFYGGNTGLTLNQPNICMFLHGLRMCRRGWNEEDYWTAREYARAIYMRYHSHYERMGGQAPAPLMQFAPDALNVVLWGTTRDAKRLETWTEWFEVMRKSSQFDIIAALGSFFTWNERPPLSEELFVEHETHTVLFPAEMARACFKQRPYFALGVFYMIELERTNRSARDFEEHGHHRAQRRSIVQELRLEYDRIVRSLSVDPLYRMTLDLQLILFHCGAQLFQEQKVEEAYVVWSFALGPFIALHELPPALRVSIAEGSSRWSRWTLADWRCLHSEGQTEIRRHPQFSFRAGSWYVPPLPARTAATATKQRETPPSVTTPKRAFSLAREVLWPMSLPITISARDDDEAPPTPAATSVGFSKRGRLQSRQLCLALYLAATRLRKSIWIRLSWLIQAWKWLPYDNASVGNCLSLFFIEQAYSPSDPDHDWQMSPPVRHMVNELHHFLIRAYAFETPTPKPAERSGDVNPNRRKRRQQRREPDSIHEITATTTTTTTTTTTSSPTMFPMDVISCMLGLRTAVCGSRLLPELRWHTNTHLFYDETLLCSEQPLPKSKVVCVSEAKTTAGRTSHQKDDKGSVRLSSDSVLSVAASAAVQKDAASQDTAGIVETEIGFCLGMGQTLVCGRSADRGTLEHHPTVLQSLLRAGSLSQLFQPLSLRFVSDASEPDADATARSDA